MCAAQTQARVRATQTRASAPRRPLLQNTIVNESRRRRSVGRSVASAAGRSMHGVGEDEVAAAQHDQSSSSPKNRNEKNRHESPPLIETNNEPGAAKFHQLVRSFLGAALTGPGGQLGEIWHGYQTNQMRWIGRR